MEQVIYPITTFIPDSFWVRYSNENRDIEGLTADPDSVTYLRAFVEGPLSVTTLCDYVWSEANQKIRSEPWMNVRVASHVAPPGGERVVQELENIIASALVDSPYETHGKFLYLHPFLDGNGRSARAILAWQALRNPVWAEQIKAYSILKAIYFMALDHADAQIERGTFVVSS